MALLGSKKPAPAPDRHPTLACPSCGEHKARDSKPRGLHELILKLIRVKPYRCRGCRHRFWRFGAPPLETQILAQGELEEDDLEQERQNRR